MMLNTHHHSVTTRSLTHFIGNDKINDKGKDTNTVHLLPLTESGATAFSTMSAPPSRRFNHNQRRRVSHKAANGGRNRNKGSNGVAMTLITIVVCLLLFLILNHLRQKDAIVFGKAKSSSSPPPMSSFLRGYSSSSLLSLEQLTAHLMAYSETNKEGGLGLLSDSLSSLEQLTAHFLVFISNRKDGLLTSSSLLGEDGTHLYRSDHHYDDFEKEYYL